ncbi:diacylglycerol kinase family protein [Phytohabitans kaempferiae]|uniref:Diacylglycerol kinase family protein n=1 Tax=Phytohabitans kaempferiae TaxID=1620943 RepID=A0ABV6LUP1_9ACTN
MYDVVLLTLGGGCGAPRVPVLACADALTAAGATVETVTAESDADIDATLDGRRLVVASATDGQLRAVIRRMVRRAAPAPSKRPADLPANRTVPDLPPIGLLPLDPTADDLASQLDLPRDPAEVAKAVLGDKVRRLDLLRNDGGSVTLDGALVGSSPDVGEVLWHGRVEVDDAVLSDGADPILACAVGNGGGYARLDGLPLLTTPDPADGVVEVAVAVPVVAQRLLRRPRMRIEVRRARGRAVAITPRESEIEYVDDGVRGTLSHKRSWWIEPGAWAVYVR